MSDFGDLRRVEATEAPSRPVRYSRPRPRGVPALWYDPEEWYDQDLWKAVAAETFATGTFIFIVTGTPVFQSVVGGGSSSITGIAFTFGLTVAVLAYVFGGISGCHLNPAVTWSQWMARRVSGLRLALYTAAQLFGATIGSTLVWAVGDGYVVPDGNDGYISAWDKSAGAVNFVRLSRYGDPSATDQYATTSAFLVELIGTMLLCLVVMAIGDKKRAASDKHNPILGPVAAGLAVFLANIMAIAVTNCSINPARTFGPAVVLGGSHIIGGVAGPTQTAWSYMWLFWLAPLMGATIATLAWRYIFEDFLICLDRYPADDRSTLLANEGGAAARGNDMLTLSDDAPAAA